MGTVGDMIFVAAALAIFVFFCVMLWALMRMSTLSEDSMPQPPDFYDENVSPRRDCRHHTESCLHTKGHVDNGRCFDCPYFERADP